MRLILLCGKLPRQASHTGTVRGEKVGQTLFAFKIPEFLSSYSGFVGCRASWVAYRVQCHGVVHLRRESRHSRGRIRPQIPPSRQRNRPGALFLIHYTPIGTHTL